jgi:hypothetical protein
MAVGPDLASATDSVMEAPGSVMADSVLALAALEQDPSDLVLDWASE